MNGVHDMGGMHGFGPVEMEKDEPVFHEPWEGRVFAMQRSYRTRAPSAPFRFDLERIDPVTYLRASYYERWLLRLERALVREGSITAQELAERIARYRQHPDAPPPRREDPVAVQPFLTAERTHQSPRRDVARSPRFRVGDAVRARNVHPPGHIRMPRYVRGKLGTINRVYGFQDVPDTDEQGDRIYAEPQPLYNVQFDAAELWGQSAEPRGRVCIDLWESYLEAA